jgi:hypothetical protein
MATAKLVSRNVSPIHSHDCNQCRFVGRLDGKDLYVCRKPGLPIEYIARFGSTDREYTSLGDWTPEGTEYNLAKQIEARRLPPNQYRTAR